MESHSEEEDPPGAGSGLGWNGRSPQAQSPGACSAEAMLARKKHRRRPSKRKRHWRPYLELSWAEKQQRDERQSQRASRVREEMFAKGQPVAPYNTTQFLMNDRDPEEPNLDVPQGASHPGSSGESEAGDSDAQGRAHGEFQQKDFSEAYAHPFKHTAATRGAPHSAPSPADSCVFRGGCECTELSAQGQAELLSRTHSLRFPSGSAWG